MDENKKLLWTQAEVVNYLSLGKSTVQTLTASGRLPSIKIGARRLYPVDEVRQWVSSIVEDSGHGENRGIDII
jgi:excisionase family DNA binding protein